MTLIDVDCQSVIFKNEPTTRVFRVSSTKISPNSKLLRKNIMGCII